MDAEPAEGRHQSSPKVVMIQPKRVCVQGVTQDIHEKRPHLTQTLTKPYPNLA